MNNQLKYLSKLLEVEITCKDDIEKYELKVKKALRKAWEIRNFEIDLYWKRAIYFWGFIALAFTGVFGILRLQQDIFVNPILNKYFFLTLNCILGSFLSFGWYLSNRGAKYFQVNWEMWIKYLEEFTYGKLYTNPIDISDMNTSLFNVGKFSLSRINIISSLVITIVWWIMALIFAYNISLEHEICSIIITVFSIFISCYCLVKEAKS